MRNNKKNNERYRRRHRMRIRIRARLWARAHRKQMTKYAKKYYWRNRERCIQVAAKCRKAHPKKICARSILKNAVHSGQVIRPNRCQHCGKCCRPHGHHPNYDRPLAVLWLCTVCHGKEHQIP